MSSRSVTLVVLALVALAAAAFALSSGAGRGAGAPRTIELVAREMAFASEAAGDGPANPTIELRPGERVRLVFTNLDRGMRHDLVVPGLGLRSALLAHGESDALEFTAPEAPGAYDYFCSLHARMMRGRIVVR